MCVLQVVDGAVVFVASLARAVDDCAAVDASTCTMFMGKRRGAFDLTGGCVQLVSANLSVVLHNNALAVLSTMHWQC